MKRELHKLKIIIAGFVLVFLYSCHSVDEYANDPYGNFDALWSILDERYCFFEYKDIDWNQIREKYRSRITEQMTDEELFGVMDEMLKELKGGHVNLSTPFNISRYWKWFEDYPKNFDERLIDEYYLAFDYKIAGGIKYKILTDNIGYMYYGSFSSTVGESNLDYILSHLSICDGIVIDVRGNGGGSLTNVNTIASRFINEKRLIGYISHKSGPGHKDLSEPYPYYLEPSSRIRYQKPVVVLTNRETFSAANNFVSVMKGFPTVTIVGDVTGGGSGLPFSSELPNGWTIRFSASPIYDAEKQHTEFGVSPSEGYKVDMDMQMALEGKDTMLNTALSLLRLGMGR